MKGKFSILVISLLISFFLFTITVNAVPNLCSWQGYANISGTIVDSRHNVAVHNGTRVVNATIFSGGQYVADVESATGANVTFKICGVDAAQGAQSFSCGTSRVILNISATAAANGASCTYSCGCTGGYCCSGATEYNGTGTGTCQSSVCTAPTTTTTTTTTTGGGGTVTPSPSVSGPAPAKPAEEKPKPVEVPVTPVEEVVTEEKVVSEVLQGVTAEDLGITELTSEKVEVVRTGVGEATISADASQVVANIDSVLPEAVEEKAKQTLNEVRETVSVGTSSPVVVSSSVQTFEVTSKETGKKSTVSKVNLKVEAKEQELEDVKVVETIPKSVAASVTEVIFTGEKPEVLQADPIVKWEFDIIPLGQSKDLSYLVKKKLEKITIQTIAVAKAITPPLVIEVPVEKPSLLPIEVIIIIIVIISIAAYIFGRRRHLIRELLKNFGVIKR